MRALAFILLLALAAPACAGEFTMPGERAWNPANLLWQFAVGPRSAKSAIDPRGTIITAASLAPNLTLPNNNTTFQGLQIVPVLSFTGGSAQMQWIRIGGKITRNYGPGTLNFMTGIYSDYESTAANTGASCTTGSPPCPLPWLPDFFFDNSTRTLTQGTVNDNTAGPNGTGQLDLFDNITPTIRVLGTSTSLTLGGGVVAHYWKPALKADPTSSVLTVDRLSQLWDNGATVCDSTHLLGDSTCTVHAGTVTVNKWSTIYAKDRDPLNTGYYAVVDSDVNDNGSFSGKKWLIRGNGTAKSYFTGQVNIGSNANPTDMLQVTGGDVSVMSGTLNLHKTAASIASPFNMASYAAGDTLSTDTGSYAVLQMSAAVQATAGGPLWSTLDFGGSITRKTAAGAFTTLGTFKALANHPSIILDTLTGEGGGAITGIHHNPTIQTINSATVTSGGTSLGVDVNLTLTQTSGTLNYANNFGLRMNDATGTGALTTQRAIDCEAMSKATGENACIRGNVASGANNYFLKDDGGAQSKFTGKITTYNNVAADSSHSGVPLTGWSVTLTAQTANKTATNIIASATAGRYRLTCYVTETSAGTGSGTDTIPLCNLICTDVTDSTAKTIPVTATLATSTTGDARSGAAECDQKGASAIQYSTTGYTSKATTAMQYKLYATLEVL